MYYMCSSCVGCLINVIQFVLTDCGMFQLSLNETQYLEHMDLKDMSQAFKTIKLCAVSVYTTAGSCAVAGVYWTFIRMC